MASLTNDTATTHEEIVAALENMNSDQFKEIFGEYPKPPPATKIDETDMSVKQQMVVDQINGYREWCFKHEPYFTAEQTLAHVKHVCDINDLDINIVKEVFDQVEASFYYDIKKDKAVNPEDNSDSDDGEAKEVFEIPDSEVDFHKKIRKDASFRAWCGTDEGRQACREAGHVVNPTQEELMEINRKNRERRQQEEQEQAQGKKKGGGLFD
jgi:hypothetical protein|tara:strand:+ start:114 stop:746 length:633 start_codon:yes stop_codon:yes gene_type:complete